MQLCGERTKEKLWISILTCQWQRQIQADICFCLHLNRSYRLLLDGSQIRRNWHLFAAHSENGLMCGSDRLLG